LNKYPFQIVEKIDTIWRKEHVFSTESGAMATICKHPRVRIVSRHEDSEFVECMECGEVFDADEFRDMEIEETAETEDVTEDD
jgi:glycyl-tRNA synthetase (class II)